VEFDLPVAFFWTFNTGTHFGGRRDGPAETEIDRVNRFVWKHIKRVRALPEDFDGLPSADSDPGRPLEIGVTDTHGKMTYADDFDTQKCLTDAAFEGFRDCVMNGETLSVRGYRGRPADAALIYRFQGDFAAKSPKVALTARTHAALNGKVSVAISTDGTTWEREVHTTKSRTETLTLTTNSAAAFRAIKEFQVRIRLTGDAGSREEPPASIDDLRIVADIVPPKSSVISLKPSADDPSLLAYEDDFHTRKYLQTTQRTDDDLLEWAPGSIGVRLRPGGSRVSLIWRIQSEQRLRNIQVRVDGRANRGSLGTNLQLEVSSDGKMWEHSVDTTRQDTDANGWCRDGLTLDLSDSPKFQGVKSWLVRLTLSAPSYKDVHPAQSGLVQRVRIEATP
jgi:hypothetical protein